MKDDELSQVSEPQAGNAELCGLEGCDVPLPVRALDEQGRPKGGRRPQYCGKAHADAASRQRRARDVASVADPLSLAHAAGEAFLPAARQLAAQLSELIARFDEAETAALARVRVAEQEAAAAVAEAGIAREEAEAAEQARRQALALARQDRQAKDNAIREAERARQEGEQIRATAWEQVAAHERGRGQAEAARVAVQHSADELIAQNRQLRAQLEQAQTDRVELTARLAAAGQDQERAEGHHRALLARIEVVERLSEQDGDRFRARLAAEQARSADLQAELAAARTVAASQRKQEKQIKQAERRALSSGAWGGTRRQRKVRAIATARRPRAPGSQ
jgi:chromosome segregation ATPase